MNSNSIEEIHIATILDNRRANKEGKYPIKIRVTHKGKRIYYSTGKYLSIIEWINYTTEKKNMSKDERDLLKAMKITAEEQKSIKDDIKAVFDKVEDNIKELNENEEFSFDNLNRRIKNSIGGNINEAFAAKIEALQKEGRIGTKISYECALKSIEKFAGTSISFQIITQDWLQEYVDKLRSDGKTTTTAGFYLRCLRAILNKAITARELKQGLYPFGKGKFQIPTGEGRKLALTNEQIKLVANFSDGLEATVLYRDLWLFSLHCNGMNFIDLLKLKYKDMANGEISFKRQKTIRTSKKEKLIKATITPIMQDIINRLGNPIKTPNNHIFPYLTGKETPTEEKKKVQDIVKRTNKQLKKIGTALGIEKMNTYTARHSYANILLKGSASVSFIADQLGHSNIKTTESYLNGFDKQEREKFADLFSDLK